MSLKLKIFFTFITVSIISVLLVNVIWLYRYVSDMIDSMTISEQKNLNLIVNDIDNFLDGLNDMTASFVLDEGIKDVLVSIHENTSFSNYNSHLQEICDKLFIYGHNVNRKIWRIGIYSDKLSLPYISTRNILDSDINYSAKGWYQELQERNALAITYGVHTEGNIRCITVARPIIQTYTKQLLGHIALDINTDRFSEFWHANASGNESPSFYYLYDDTGVLICSSDPSGADGFANKISGNPRRYLHVSSTSDQYGWRIDALIPQEHMLDGISIITKAISGMLCLVALLALGSSWFLSAIITMPIQKIYQNILQFSMIRDADLEDTHSVSSEMLQRGFDRMTEQMLEMTAENNRKEELLRHAELMVRQAQINPHFIYNTLDSIKWIADMQGAQRIVRALDATIRLLRFSAKRDSFIISIREELHFCKDYMNLIGLKNLDNINVVYDVRLSDTENYQVPRFILQPILENSIQHGFRNRMAGNQIVVTILRKDSLLKLIVRDNGMGMDQSRIESILYGEYRKCNSYNQIGIYNVDQRIKDIYGEQYGISISSQINVGTEVVIQLPALAWENKEALNDTSSHH